MFNAKAFGIEGFEQIFMGIDFSGNRVFDLEIFGTAVCFVVQGAFFGVVRADKFEALSVAFRVVPGAVIFHRVAGFAGWHGE